jgi:hypothetical protein
MYGIGSPVKEEMQSFLQAHIGQGSSPFLLPQVCAALPSSQGSSSR